MSSAAASVAGLAFRPAALADLDALLQLEAACFATDRLSRRSFRRWLQAPHGSLLVAERDSTLLGYGLIWCHRGTRLARLYSLAVDPAARGQGVASGLLQALEAAAARRGRLFMRLEVAASNSAAIRLYENSGYRAFGAYPHYYEDEGDALRMQKTIQRVAAAPGARSMPWYPQSTEFTCGPAALMMAMAGLGADLALEQALELDLWREATTIYMTSGHGGCHPLGLALAAARRGFHAEVYINSSEPLFLDGVRSDNKKQVMTTVHNHFVEQAVDLNVGIVHAEIDMTQIGQWLEQGCAVLVLISTYRLDGRKSPHWVTVTAIDEHCLYVHDPDVSREDQFALDCQHLPIARDDFARMASFGAARLRTALAIRVEG
ncbi:GNAT family N-acetyltransferase [Seongchinamella sediminis]|uniref:GNAT family N-acetyltransferase n=1 Tax=Seongchinamella sediminis TaxID=2283635 RepID=A0A3L7DYD6_9GAMM|nr:peptidase C39 family protein [Seongchinamella sediminis]RLQ22617.1 GNAT family N-acetyltransferase [Seongchinamella sediminis]